MTEPVDLLPRIPGVMWTNLPVLSLGSLVVGVAVVATMVAGPGLTPVALVVAAVTVGPAWAGLLATTCTLLLGGDAKPRDLLAGIARSARPAVAVFAVPAAAGILALVALAMWQQRRSGWLVVPLTVSTGATILTCLGSVAALPLRLWQPELRGRALWYTALTVLAARPTVGVGVLAAIVLGDVAETSWTASLLPLLAAPVALLASAGVWAAAKSAGFPVPGSREQPWCLNAARPEPRLGR